ncbi:hypothetical protein SAMN04488025_10638 [Planifilum fulgidum]|uniref:Ketoreductase domain-containing protein n=1 Tax=Planifilum fulgidum TaxID=201973 RepID=A0A1I2M0A2_9BACL|nr:SDR family oxidoreductase [Planifilum fulgidum]SFF82816.1 hypothetical protein SAMN04488025_10638 [Planifilum fulgidum]
MHRKSVGKTVLITGASTGIGAELAKRFAEGGFDLILVARNRDKLERLAEEAGRRFGVSVRVVVKDLSEPAACGELIRELEEAGIEVHVLVNNAGIGVYGPFAETDWEREREMIRLNIEALTRLTKAFLPGMLRRGEGKILNVASTAAFQPGPLMSVYYASKAYVLSFTEAIAEEVRGTGVTVTALCPGPTRTEFGSRAGFGTSRLFQRGEMDAETVAREGFRGLMSGRRVAIPGLSNRLLVGSVRFLPRGLITRIMKRIQKTREVRDGT